MAFLFHGLNPVDSFYAISSLLLTPTIFDIMRFAGLWPSFLMVAKYAIIEEESVVKYYLSNYRPCFAYA